MVMLEIFLPTILRVIRVEFFWDEIDRITEVDVLTGEIRSELKHAAISRHPIMLCHRARSREQQMPSSKK